MKTLAQCDLEVQFLRFDAGTLKNEWISSVGMKVYLRHGVHLIGGSLMRTLDVATVEFDPKLQGKGYLTTFLDFVLQNTREPFVYLENVQTPRLAAFYHRRGFTMQANSDPASPCFYKRAVSALKLVSA